MYDIDYNNLKKIINGVNNMKVISLKTTRQKISSEVNDRV